MFTFGKHKSFHCTSLQLLCSLNSESEQKLRCIYKFCILIFCEFDTLRVRQNPVDYLYMFNVYVLTN